MESRSCKNMTLKNLETYRNKLLSERAILVMKHESLTEELRTSKRKIADVEKQIRHFTSIDIIVSEHAIVRYLERVENINISEVKEKILTPKLIEMVTTLGNGIFPLEGFRVKVVNRVVVTVLI